MSPDWIAGEGSRTNPSRRPSVPTASASGPPDNWVRSWVTLADTPSIEVLVFHASPRYSVAFAAAWIAGVFGPNGFTCPLFRRGRIPVVDAFGQLGIDVQIRHVGIPSAEYHALQPQNDARLVRDIRDVPVAGERGPVADQQVRRVAAGDPLHEGGRIVGARVGATRPLEQECIDAAERRVRRHVE